MNTDEHLNIIANCLSLDPTLQIYTYFMAHRMPNPLLFAGLE